MTDILVVEDNKNTQLLTATRLKPYFEVVCADDGLDALDDETLVLVHDGARPFITEDVITRTIQMAESRGAAIAAVPASIPAPTTLPTCFLSIIIPLSFVFCSIIFNEQ